MSLTIAVTGAAGLVGTGVCRAALEGGHTVVGIDIAPQSSIVHDRFSYKVVDSANHDAFKKAVKECNAIIHLAATWTQRDSDGNVIRDVPQHQVHNINTAASYNALSIAAELGIERIVLASSVNSIGMIHSEKPRFDYLPLDEKHPFYPEDAYALCKYFVELQSDSFARKYPNMRIATLRFHLVVPDEKLVPDRLQEIKPNWKDLWGWVSLSEVARACLLGLTVSETTFPKGHETFFIVGPTVIGQRDSLDLLKEKYPEITDFRKEIHGNDGFFDCSKAERMLGWKETKRPWN